MDVKLINAQLSKIIQLGGFIGNNKDKVDRKAVIKVAVNLAKNIFQQLATRETLSVFDNFEKNAWKWSGARPVRSGKKFALLIWHKDMDQTIRIKRFSSMNLWCYWNSKTWNKKTKKWIVLVVW